MQNSRAKTIKGLSIACIILTALCMAAFIIATVVFAAMIQYYEPIMDYVGNSVSGSVYDFSSDHHGYSYGYGGSPYYYDYNFTDIDDVDAQVVIFGLQFCIAIFVIGFIMQAFALVASIIMMVNSNKPEKLGLAFGWGIAGAILGGLSGGFVQMVLFIVAVVFIYKDRQMYLNGQYPVTVNVQYGAPTGNPNQPVQPGAPVDIYPNANTYQSAPQGAPVAQQPAPSSATVGATAAPVAAAATVAAQPAAPMDAQSEQTLEVADELLAPTEADEVIGAQVDVASGDAADPNAPNDSN